MARRKIDTGPAANTPPDKKVETFKRRYKRARGNFDAVAPIISECYEYVLPLRQGPYPDGGASAMRGDRVFDGTAGDAAQALASKMLDDGWPTDQKPFELQAGPELEVSEGEREDYNRALAEVSEHTINVINNSTYRAAGHEGNLDWTIGLGTLLIEDGGPIEPIRVRSLPLSQCYYDMGPTGERDALFTCRKHKAGDLAIAFPGANLGDDLARMARDKPDEPVDVAEGYERDWKDPGRERWVYRAVAEKQDQLLVEHSEEGEGSRPFIDYGFMQVPGEVYSRGPSQAAINDIRTLNVVKELLLENADIRIGGVWQYDDMGVINPDTIRIQSGSLIPRLPGTTGLEPLNTAGDPQLAQFIIQDMQTQVRGYYHGLDLGPTDSTPMSAQEVLQRSAERAGRLSGPYSRYMTEHIFRLIKRVVFLLKKRGDIDKLPVINGRQIRIKPLAPITRSQALDDVLRTDRFMEMLNTRLGPQATQVVVNGEEYANWLGGKLGVDPRIVRTKLQREEFLKAMAMAAQATGQLPGADQQEAA